MDEHIHDFQIDLSRTHKRPGRCFTICKCGKTGQASLVTGRRFTTARRPAPEKKMSTGLKTYPSQRELLSKHGLSVQKFFDLAYADFVGKVYPDAV